MQHDSAFHVSFSIIFQANSSSAYLHTPSTFLAIGNINTNHLHTYVCIMHDVSTFVIKYFTWYRFSAKY